MVGLCRNGKTTDNGRWLWSQALPYYVPMVQTWLYKVIGQNNLIYQIANNAPLTWSISTEWFSYCSYPVIAYCLVRLTRTVTTLAVTIGYVALTYYLISLSISTWPSLNAWGISHFGPIADVAIFQDSFIRWVFYFSPYARMTEFLLGCLACHLFIKMQALAIKRWERIFGQTLEVLAIVGAFLLYWGMFVRKPALIGPPLNLVFGLSPMMATITFCSARYQTPITRFLGLPLFTLGGEISYAIYLTHFLVFIELSRFVPPSADFASYTAVWIIFFVGIIFTLFWATLVYRFYEMPIRTLIRQATFEQMKHFGFYLKLLLPLVGGLIALHLILVVTLKTHLAQAIVACIISLLY